MSATDVSMFDSCSFTHQFKLNFERIKSFVAEHLSSGDISAGGHLWRIKCQMIKCYTCGNRRENESDYMSVFLHHESETKDAKAIFEAFVMGKDGAPSLSHRRRLVHVYTPKGTNNSSRGWQQFVKRSDLAESHYVTNGSVIIMCRVKVLHNDPIGVPPSNITSHLGSLLDSADGSDICIVLSGEEFPAHRALLTARSPVFKAQLLGSMADAKMASITLQDIAPATFRVMLRLMYTDEFPADTELGDSPIEKLQNVFVAADRFALVRLKLFCLCKLWDYVSADTIGDALTWAETYNCSELKSKCIEFLRDEKNFMKTVLTDGFIKMLQQFPSLLAEIKVKVGA